MTAVRNALLPIKSNEETLKELLQQTAEQSVIAVKNVAWL
jgi:hypothetical protein